MNDTIKLFVAILFVSTALVGMMAATQWIDEKAGQHGCEKAYGENAEYIGDTSFFGGSAICDVDGEQKYAQPSMGWIAGSTE